MKYLILFLVFTCFVIAACTKDKTDYEAILDETTVEQHEFQQVAAIATHGYTIYIETRNGKFYTGYNEIRVHVKNGSVEQGISSITFLPTTTNDKQQLISCPHQNTLTSSPNASYSVGYSVFTQENEWKLDISFTAEGKLYQVNHPIVVEKQTNKNLGMTSFIGKDSEEYLIALIAPQKPKAGENDLIAGIYKKMPAKKPTLTDVQYTYKRVVNHRLRLDPRMPEPSMGNHSSPNNQDLLQRDDGWYHGVVNYTMTGNWTLNFILENHRGEIIKGTEVPADFTPGIEGVKGELHIDILF